MPGSGLTLKVSPADAPNVNSKTHPYRSKKERKMNTTEGSSFGANKETARNPLDVRIILAVLWVAGMLSSLNGDTYRLNDPAVLKASLENNGPIVVTPGLLSVMAIIFVGPILMSALTLMLKSRVSRWANRIMGIFYAVVILAFWVLGFVLTSAGYEMVWSTAQLVFALLVVWYAWKWPNPEG
jgi:hypothetical protein